MMDYRYDTQLLIEGAGLDEDEIHEAGDEDLVKLHFHTNKPWEILEYCASLGEIFDIVVEDMDRQARGLKG